MKETYRTKMAKLREDLRARWEADPGACIAIMKEEFPDRPERTNIASLVDYANGVSKAPSQAMFLALRRVTREVKVPTPAEAEPKKISASMIRQASLQVLDAVANKGIRHIRAGDGVNQRGIIDAGLQIKVDNSPERIGQFVGERITREIYILANILRQGR
jgi:hypothetical protein